MGNKAKSSMKGQIPALRQSGTISRAPVHPGLKLSWHLRKLNIIIAGKKLLKGSWDPAYHLLITEFANTKRGHCAKAIRPRVPSFSFPGNHRRHPIPQTPTAKHANNLSHVSKKTAKLSHQPFGAGKIIFPQVFNLVNLTYLKVWSFSSFTLLLPSSVTFYHFFM